MKVSEKFGGGLKQRYRIFGRIIHIASIIRAQWNRAITCHGNLQFNDLHFREILRRTRTFHWFALKQTSKIKKSSQSWDLPEGDRLRFSKSSHLFPVKFSRRSYDANILTVLPWFQTRCLQSLLQSHESALLFCAKQYLFYPIVYKYGRFLKALRAKGPVLLCLHVLCTCELLPAHIENVFKFEWFSWYFQKGLKKMKMLFFNFA